MSYYHERCNRWYGRGVYDLVFGRLQAKAAALVKVETDLRATPDPMPPTTPVIAVANYGLEEPWQCRTIVEWPLEGRIA